MSPANKIRFNKKLYSLKSVETAAEIYEEFARFKIVNGEKYLGVEVDIADNGEDSGQITDEFKNYVLFLNINHAGN